MFQVTLPHPKSTGGADQTIRCQLVIKYLSVYNSEETDILIYVSPGCKSGREFGKHIRNQPQRKYYEPSLKQTWHLPGANGGFRASGVKIGTLNYSPALAV